MISLVSRIPSFKSGFKQYLVDIAICARTLGRYCHSELVFGDVNNKSLCFSADSNVGVRFELRDVMEGDWDLLALTLTSQQQAYALTIVNEIIGEGYDWNSIKQYLLPGVVDNIDTHDCCGVVGTILSRIGYLNLPERECWKLSPSRLRELVLKKENSLGGVVRI